MKKNIILLLVTTIGLLIAAEVLCRLILPSNAHTRILIFNVQPFMVHPNGIVTYRPLSHIREVAVYERKIEYDIRYQTNNLGFIDRENYDISGKSKDGRRIGLVGDSFTSGSGYGDWVSEFKQAVRNKYQNHQYFNFSLIGAGIIEFIKYPIFFNQMIPLDEIWILSITEDLGRGAWYPLPIESTVRLCPVYMNVTDCLAKRQPSIFVENSLNDDRADVREVISKVLNHPNNDYLNTDESKSVFRLSALIQEQINKIKRSAEIKKNPEHFILQHESLQKAPMGVKSLGIIRKHFPDKKIVFFHLPAKSEIFIGQYHHELGAEITAMGIEYVDVLKSTKWSLKDFHKRDSHPNQHGYQKIKQVLTEYQLKSEPA